jgi:hypothetical protein
MLQGYYFGKSLSAENFETLLGQNDHLSGTQEYHESFDYDLLSKLEKYSKPLNI